MSLLVLCLFQSLQTYGQTFQFEMVSNLSPNAGSNPRWFTVMDTTMYFFAHEPNNGFKLYGIHNGGQPYLCSNLNSGGIYGDGTISTSKNMGVLNNKLYLPSLISPFGRELYSYDGANTPNLVMDINSGTGSSSPYYMMTFNNKLYFQANNGFLGTELWSHDPNTNSTQCLTDINPGGNSSTIAFITAFNNKLYFAGTNGNDTSTGNTGLELYCFDPSSNLTSLVFDINPGYQPSNPFGLTVINNKLYFVASEPLHGKELYVYDGINVTRLTDINPGPSQGVYTSDHSYPTLFNGSIYFAANDSNNLINLGRYDLSTNNSTILYCSGNSESGNPRYFKVFEGRLFFTNYSTSNGYELWSYDGVNPPNLTADIHPGAGSGLPIFMEVFNNELYFNAMNDTSTSEELFRLKKISNENPTEIKNQVSTCEIQLFPNPTNGLTNLNLSLRYPCAKVKLTISSLTGQVLYHQTLPTNFATIFHTLLDLKHLPIGAYIINLFNENNQVMQHKIFSKN